MKKTKRFLAVVLCMLLMLTPLAVVAETVTVQAAEPQTVKVKLDKKTGKRYGYDENNQKVTQQWGVTAKGFRYYFGKNGAAYQADQDMVGKMTGLSFVKIASYSASLKPCGCLWSDSSLNRSTTLTTRILSSGISSRRIVTAAMISSVGVSPQQAITTSGSSPQSLLAHSQIPIPCVQCLTACSMVSHWQLGCLEATIALT